jgi:hypothetical protein
MVWAQLGELSYHFCCLQLRKGSRAEWHREAEVTNSQIHFSLHNVDYIAFIHNSIS